MTIQSQGLTIHKHRLEQVSVGKAKSLGINTLQDFKVHTLNLQHAGQTKSSHDESI